MTLCTLYIADCTVHCSYKVLQLHFCFKNEFFEINVLTTDILKNSEDNIDMDEYKGIDKRRGVDRQNIVNRLKVMSYLKNLYKREVIQIFRQMRKCVQINIQIYIHLFFIYDQYTIQRINEQMLKIYTRKLINLFVFTSFYLVL